MPPLLYLDTARLGPMTPAAQDAQLDFVRLSAEEPSSLYFEEFLRDGFAAWPLSYQERFPGLGTWNGAARLKQSIRRLAGAPDDWQVLLANRSLSLVNLAVRCQFHICRNVLATDLSWPTYQQALDRRAAATGNRVTTTPLREQILRQGWSATDVVEYLATVFVANQCDGLFLPAVDNLGIRLPIRHIVQGIEQIAKLRFVFIDAAQAFCQVPIADCVECADFIVAGGHKWLGAYLPIGIGMFGQQRTREVFENCLRTDDQGGQPPDDPLLRLIEQLESNGLDGHSETANLGSLFSCAGATQDRLARAPLAPCQIPNLHGLWQIMQQPPGQWLPRLPAEPMRSRILLLELINASSNRLNASATRLLWQQSGAVVSTYPGNLVRISWPQKLL